MVDLALFAGRIRPLALACVFALCLAGLPGAQAQALAQTQPQLDSVPPPLLLGSA